MAQEIINVGASANDGTGDTLRVAFQKVNSNFTENYSSITNFSNTFSNYLPLSGGTMTGNITFAGTQTFPSTVVTTTGTQTLANKTLTSPTINAGIASGLTLNDGYTEEIFAVTGTTPVLSPTNGSIQTWTLSGASTPTAGTWADGQSITLMIDDGTANTINWSSVGVTWKTNAGSAPALLTTGFTVIQLWRVGGVIYGARVGDA